MRHYSDSPLLTDFYELTMLQAYYLEGMNERASFELFVRRLPERRNFLIAAGLEQAVGYLTGLRFDQEDIAWLCASGRFDFSFIRSLEDFHFSGDVDAMPEGTVFFADEPILRITAPLIEAQLIESRIINLMHFATLVASKAARSVHAAGGKQLIDFGLRRAHGAEAGLLSARASYIAGFDGTATAMAAAMFDIPAVGTMAHSFIEAHEHETDAFASFARAFPGGVTLLIDTYDTCEAAKKAARLARRLKKEHGVHVRAVRIDSGDLAAEARAVRRILDAEGEQEIGIFASGNLDEDALHEMLAAGAPIDGFGIGTRMNTSSDMPYLDCAYKLVEYAGRPRCKLSAGKATWPGKKQVFRRLGADGIMQEDTVALEGETAQGFPLLKPVMRGGMPISALPSLPEIRMHAKSQIAALPERLRSLEPAPSYAVSFSSSLRNMAAATDDWLREREKEDEDRWLRKKSRESANRAWSHR